MINNIANQLPRKKLMSIEAHSLSENLLVEIKKSKRICNPENYLKAANILITNLLVQRSVRIGRGHTKFPAVSKRFGCALSANNPHPPF